MDLPPFRLERWLASHEATAPIHLAESGIRSLPGDRFRFDWPTGPLDYVIPTNGDPALRTLIGERYGRGPESVLLTNGTQEANFTAILATLASDEHAVIVTPTYQSLYSVPDTIGKVTEVRLEPPRWQLDVDRVADAVRPETGLIILANPNNPTGRYHPPETIRALAELAADRDAVVLCDEVYRELTPTPDPPAASLSEHVISTAGLSKAYGLAGLRIGWAVGPEPSIQAAWAVKDYTTISPSRPGQTIARTVLEDDALEADILRENRTLVRENRERVSAFLANHGLDWSPPAGVVGFVRLPDGAADARSFCTALLDEEGVLLVPGDVFDYPAYVRIGFGVDPATLEEGLDRLGRFLNG